MTETPRDAGPTVALQTLQVEPVALQTQPPEMPLQTVPGAPAAVQTTAPVAPQTVGAVALQTAPDSVSSSGAQYEPRAQREGELAPLVS